MAKSSESIVYGLKGMSFGDKRESSSTKGMGLHENVATINGVRC